MAYVDDRYRVAPTYGDEVETVDERGGAALRIFQILVGVTGAVLFIAGLVAVFRVNFSSGFFMTSGEVAGFGFSAALAIAAIVLGGAIMALALADQDRGGTAIVGLLTLLVGIGALIVADQFPRDVSVDRSTAAAFVVLGAIAFVGSLIPWWSGRRRRTVVR